MTALKRDRSAAFVTHGDALICKPVISQSIVNKRLMESVTDVTGFCMKRLNAHAHRKSYVFTCHDLSPVTPIWMIKEYRP